MAKQYKHVGSVPVVVENYGRVVPGKVFSCEMTPEQETFFRKIGALQVVADVLPDAVDVAPLDSVAPTSWPVLPSEQFKKEGVKPL
jgi:hypothetical protein